MCLGNVIPPRLSIDAVPDDCIVQKNGSPWAKVTLSIARKKHNRIAQIPCSVVINSKTQKIYNNDCERDLRIKFLALTIFTAFTLSIKTIYHCFIPLSLSIEIYKTVEKFNRDKIINNNLNNKNLTTRIFKTVGKSLIDIVKTPLYAVAMTSIAIGICVASLFKAELLYDGREVYGKLARSLNWGDRKTIWVVAPCMQNNRNLSFNARKRIKAFDQIDYSSKPGTVLFGLTNLVAIMHEIVSVDDLKN